LVVKGTPRPVENVAMRTPSHTPEPELATDLRATTDLDPEADPWSTGYIVFSLGPDFDDPTFAPG
jgi:hypothetical protein